MTTTTTTTMTTTTTAATAAAAAASKAKNNNNNNSTSNSSSFSPLSALRLLTATPQATRLLLVVVLSGAAAQGLSDTIAQFLQQRLGFEARDQALLLAVAGGGGVITQAFVFPFLLSWGIVKGEAGLLRCGLAASMAELFALCFAQTRAVALSAVGVGALGGGLSFPAASALASDSGPEGGQGHVQGALSAARSGAAAVGPVCFAIVYFVSARALPQPAFAGAPFAFGASLLAVALFLAMRIGEPVFPSSSDPEGRATRGDGEERGEMEAGAAPLISVSQRESEA